MGSARSPLGTRRLQARSQDTQRPRHAGELMGHEQRMEQRPFVPGQVSWASLRRRPVQAES